MDIQIREYVEKLFINAPSNAKVRELKEEIIANLNDKFSDLVSTGMDQQQAYNRVIAGIGDIDELIRSQCSPIDFEEVARQNKKCALLTSIAVGLYIFSIIPIMIMETMGYNEDFGAGFMLILAAIATGIVVYSSHVHPKKGMLVDETTKKFAAIKSFAISLYVFAIVPVIILDALKLNENLGVIFMFLIAGIATIVLIFNSMTRPKYVKADDTMVEEFKQWQFEKQKPNSTYKLIETTIWIIAVVVYVLISFFFVAWAFSWLVFIIAAVINKIVKLCFELV